MLKPREFYDEQCDTASSCEMLLLENWELREKLYEAESDARYYMRKAHDMEEHVHQQSIQHQHRTAYLENFVQHFSKILAEQKLMMPLVVYLDDHAPIS